MATTFGVTGSFAIKGRGLVIAGHPGSGSIRAGASVAIPDSKGTPRHHRITAVESANAPDGQGHIRPHTGLVLGQIPLSDIPSARRHLVPGRVLTIVDAPPVTGPLFSP